MLVPHQFAQARSGIRNPQDSAGEFAVPTTATGRRTDSGRPEALRLPHYAETLASVKAEQERDCITHMHDIRADATARVTSTILPATLAPTNLTTASGHTPATKFSLNLFERAWYFGLPMQNPSDASAALAKTRVHVQSVEALPAELTAVHRHIRNQANKPLTRTTFAPSQSQPTHPRRPKPAAITYWGGIRAYRRWIRPVALWLRHRIWRTARRARHALVRLNQRRHRSVVRPSPNPTVTRLYRRVIRQTQPARQKTVRMGARMPRASRSNKPALLRDRNRPKPICLRTAAAFLAHCLRRSPTVSETRASVSLTRLIAQLRARDQAQRRSPRPPRPTMCFRGFTLVPLSRLRARGVAQKHLTRPTRRATYHFLAR